MDTPPPSSSTPPIVVGRDTQFSPDYAPDRSAATGKNTALRLLVVLILVAAMVAWVMYGAATTAH